MKAVVSRLEDTVQVAIRVPWLILQYRALCASSGPLLLLVRACSSCCSPVARLSCRFSADTRAVLTASAASKRKYDSLASMPALSLSFRLTQLGLVHNLVRPLYICREIHKQPTKPKRRVFQVTRELNSVVVALPQAVFPLFICTSLLVGARRSGRVARAPPVCQSLIPSSSRCHKTPCQLVKWPVTLIINPGSVHSGHSESCVFGCCPHKLFFLETMRRGPFVSFIFFFPLQLDWVFVRVCGHVPQRQ